MQGPFLKADCPTCCTILLLNAIVTSVGRFEWQTDEMAPLSLGGTLSLGGNAALAVHKSTLQGMMLKTVENNPAPGVTVSFISSRFENSSIDQSVVNPGNVIVNSKFESALLDNTVPCSELKTRGTCDLRSVCNETSVNRQCECPFGFHEDPNDDGSRVKCLDLCDLAQQGIVSADSSKLSRSSANVTESASLTFSNFLFSDPDMKKEVSVWLVPKDGMSDVPLSALSDAAAAVRLVETGVTGTGSYELQLRSKAVGGNSGTICPLVDTLQVRCTPGKSAADAPGMPCMPLVNLTAASVRITSSTRELLFDGSSRAPIVAGDKLKLEVEVRDVAGLARSRSPYPRCGSKSPRRCSFTSNSSRRLCTF